ncbi:hypothetical protein FPZ24_09050 [Sphingomonas panacisoli]|uniref:UrcA family protein n=1 Tax=Sphingomonas panacisoli TaxID=1813879 RepID=A0A5B8LGZ7_9SPHN|nr:hypothetical protein [Sphingomonas panacisoli]QDZ07618.1 hypothetical protein FPZ24_09050 [Sphingomonas panacisoli]
MRALLLAAALFAPGSAWAASGDIGCIEAKLGPDAMQRIGNNVVAAADKGGDAATALDADREALIAARDNCRTANNWSPDAVQAAVSYTQGRATKLGAESAIKSDGLDAAKLAASYAALPAGDRKSLVAKASPGAVGAVTAAGANAKQRRHVLLYFAALAAIEFYPADFAAA